ncbi:MAG: SusD/RagB family nutrient-binding outer membrane lipoprotein [Spirosomataceae bacterium]
MKKYILTLITFSVLLTSCNDIKQLEGNPNIPTSAPASLVLQGILDGMNNGAWNDIMRYNQFYCSNYNYYSNNEYNWSGASLNYTTLKNVIKMEEEALKGGAKAVNPYSALGKFFRAYYFSQMTLRVGDLPLNDALKGLEVDKPKYDSQKAIFVQILKWLDDANTDLGTLITNSDNSLTGDYYFSGNLRQWQRTTNALRLRVLVHLSKKADDTDLKLKQDIANVLGNPTKYPLMTGAADNLQYRWNSFNKYSRNQDNYGFNATRENMAKTYVDLLKNTQDPRLFVVAEPAGTALKAGKSYTDFTAYEGASSGEDLADMSTKAGVNNGAGLPIGSYSFQNRKRYYTSYEGEPTIILGYAEQCFNIAEAINRGWATGNAEDFYTKGIEASMSFYGLKDGDNALTFSKDGGIANFVSVTYKFDKTAYFAQKSVKYAGNNADGLTQILNQKYIAFFMNSGYEAYFNWRRTGVPTFLTGPGTGNGTKIPKRFQYPSTELNVNKDNVNAALSSQFGGKDDINADMWLLK